MSAERGNGGEGGLTNQGEIKLPVGTAFVTVDDLPKLIATSMFPSTAESASSDLWSLIRCSPEDVVCKRSSRGQSDDI